MTEEPKIKFIQKPSFIHQDILYEQVNGNKFVCYRPESGYSYYSQVKIDYDIVYVPCVGDEIEKQVVLLPTQPEEYGKPHDLIMSIRDHIHRWCDVSPDFEFIASFYPLLTAIYDVVDTIVYLSLMGDTGTGKTRTQRTIGRICYRPIISSGSSSTPALKRIIEKWRGTLLSDESDIKDSDESNDFVKMLNLGFQKNQPMFNCNKDDHNKLEFFDAYCPKIISRRRLFKDSAVEARCLTEVMQQTSRQDIPELETKAFHKEQQSLRNKILKFRFDYYNKIDLDACMSIHLGDNIEPRIRQATRAFLPLLTHIPEAMERFKLFLAEHNQNLIEERSFTFDGQIVNAIASLLIDGKAEISSQDIALLLHMGEKISPASIGRRLKALHIDPKIKKVMGKAKRCIPLNETLIKVINRYVADADQRVTAVTAVTAVIGYLPPSQLSYNNKLNIKNTRIVSTVTPVNSVNLDDDLLIISEEKVRDHRFDVWLPCSVEGCNNMPCADFSNKLLCKRHQELGGGL